MKKKESRNSNVHEALKDNDDDKECEDKTELEIEGSKLIEETKRKKKNENKIKKTRQKCGKTRIRIKFNAKNRRQHNKKK